MLAFRGTLQLVDFNEASNGALQIITGTGVASVTASGGGHLSSIALPSGALQGSFTVTNMVGPGTLAGVVATLTLGSGTLTAAGGILPVRGAYALCLLTFSCSFTAPIPPTLSGTRGLGIGGAPISSMSGFFFLQGSPWRTATVSARRGTPSNTPSATAKGFAHGPASGTSSTAQIGRVIQWVTPFNIGQVSNPTNSYDAFGILRIEFVPEPGTLLLLAGGLVGLGGVGRAKRRAAAARKQHTRGHDSRT